MIVTFIGQQHTGTVSKLTALPFGTRAANAFVSYAAYLRKMVWPTDLAAFYPYPDAIPTATVIVSVAVLLSISALALALRHRLPYLLVGWLWFVVSLLPVIGFIQVGNQAIADRFTYVPLLGIFVMVAWAAADTLRGTRGRAIAGVAAIAALLGCATLTRAQVQTWSDGAAMWTRVLEVTPNSYYAHSALGAELADRGDLESARAHQQQALRLRPSDPDAHNELGKLDAERGDLESAIGHFSAATRSNQDFGEAFHNLGVALLQARRPADAIGPLQRAVTLLPQDAGSYNKLGSACVQTGRLEEARVALERAVALDPARDEYRANLEAVNRLRRGR
jgi:Flp pilus assembly protein TadD